MTMTMRSPTGDFIAKGLTFGAAKRYRYTWPGQREAIVGGEEMAALVAGSDPQQLDIHEVPPAIKTDRERTEEKP